MPIIASAKKRARQQEKRRALNLQYKKTLKTEVKAFEAAIAVGDAKLATEKLSAVFSRIDKNVKKNLMVKATAARRKSRFHKMLANLSEKPKATKKPVKKAASTK